jgi:hypothetical protein
MTAGVSAEAAIASAKDEKQSSELVLTLHMLSEQYTARLDL